MANTTLSAETGNNTSAADSFATQTNGNIGASNVSKVSLRSLLYTGNNSRIYAHFMPWFGGTNHMNVGYKSDDPVQVNKQVTDMLSRGIEGVIIDWYGPTHTRENNATLYMMKEAESRGGQFHFAITEDVGALKTCASTAGCDITQQMIDDLNYAYNTFYGSPAYMRVGSRPVVFFFGVDAYTIDWIRVRNYAQGNPMFIFRNSGGFTHVQSDGGFSWLSTSGVTSTDPMSLSYLSNFYSKALTYPILQPYGSGYKGFDDSLASWGSNRLITQQCGQTWLASMAKTGQYYSSLNQLPWVQLVTWNDYEEGTELETGIDNCVSISASQSSGLLQWSITGSESTVDHFTVFISTDGQNLMSVGELPASSRSFDVSKLGFAAGNYQLFVKAVGKPFMVNKMSAAVPYSVAQPASTGSVTIASPANNATVTSPVRIVASGTSNNPVTAMQIYVDHQLIYEQKNVGSIDTQVSMLEGLHLVVVKAWDSSGANYMQSINLNVLANQSPVTKLSVTPTSGVAPVTVAADASGSFDPDGTLASVVVDFGDGTVVKAATASHTYSVPGTYVVTATATDAIGAHSSVSQNVVVSEPASFVTITSPANGSTVGSPVLVTATAWAYSGVSSMQVYVDGKAAYQVAGSTVSTKLSIKGGNHTLKVEGTDTKGRTFSSSVSFTVAGNSIKKTN